MKIESSQVNTSASTGTQSHLRKSANNLTKSANDLAKPANSSRGPERNHNVGIENVQELERKPQSELSLSDKQRIEIINKANKALEGPYTIAEYSVHEETNVIMVKIIDKETNKVLKEFPPEKILDMVAKMWEMVGIIVDERR